MTITAWPRARSNLDSRRAVSKTRPSSKVVALDGRWIATAKGGRDSAAAHP